MGNSLDIESSGSGSGSGSDVLSDDMKWLLVNNDSMFNDSYLAEVHDLLVKFTATEVSQSEQVEVSVANKQFVSTKARHLLEIFSKSKSGAVTISSMPDLHVVNALKTDPFSSVLESRGRLMRRMQLALLRDVHRMKSSKDGDSSGDKYFALVDANNNTDTSDGGSDAEGTASRNGNDADALLTATSVRMSIAIMKCLGPAHPELFGSVAETLIDLFRRSSPLAFSNVAPNSPQGETIRAILQFASDAASNTNNNTAPISSSSASSPSALSVSGLGGANVRSLSLGLMLAVAVTSGSLLDVLSVTSQLQKGEDSLPVSSYCFLDRLTSLKTELELILPTAGAFVEEFKARLAVSSIVTAATATGTGTVIAADISNVSAGGRMNDMTGQMSSTVCTDGSYLYTWEGHTCSLVKLGTGFHGTIAGNEYARSSDIAGRIKKLLGDKAHILPGTVEAEVAGTTTKPAENETTAQAISTTAAATAATSARRLRVLHWDGFQALHLPEHLSFEEFFESESLDDLPDVEGEWLDAGAEREILEEKHVTAGLPGAGCRLSVPMYRISEREWVIGYMVDSKEEESDDDDDDDDDDDSHGSSTCWEEEDEEDAGSDRPGSGSSSRSSSWDRNRDRSDSDDTATPPYSIESMVELFGPNGESIAQELPTADGVPIGLDGFLVRSPQSADVSAGGINERNSLSESLGRSTRTGTGTGTSNTNNNSSGDGQSSATVVATGRKIVSDNADTTVGFINASLCSANGKIYLRLLHLLGPVHIAVISGVSLKVEEVVPLNLDIPSVLKARNLLYPVAGVTATTARECADVNAAEARIETEEEEDIEWVDGPDVNHATAASGASVVSVYAGHDAVGGGDIQSLLVDYVANPAEFSSTEEAEEAPQSSGRNRQGQQQQGVVFAEGDDVRDIVLDLGQGRSGCREMGVQLAASVWSDNKNMLASHVEVFVSVDGNYYVPWGAEDRSGNSSNPGGNASNARHGGGNGDDHRGSSRRRSRSRDRSRRGRRTSRRYSTDSEEDQSDSDRSYRGDDDGDNSSYDGEDDEENDEEEDEYEEEEEEEEEGADDTGDDGSSSSKQRKTSSIVVTKNTGYTGPEVFKYVKFQFGRGEAGVVEHLRVTFRTKVKKDSVPAFPYMVSDGRYLYFIHSHRRKVVCAQSATKSVDVESIENGHHDHHQQELQSSGTDTEARDPVVSGIDESPVFDVHIHTVDPLLSLRTYSITTLVDATDVDEKLLSISSFVCNGEKLLIVTKVMSHVSLKAEEAKYEYRMFNIQTGKSVRTGPSSLFTKKLHKGFPNSLCYDSRNNFIWSFDAINAQVMRWRNTGLPVVFQPPIVKAECIAGTAPVSATVGTGTGTATTNGVAGLLANDRDDSAENLFRVSVRQRVEILRDAMNDRQHSQYSLSQLQAVYLLSQVEKLGEAHGPPLQSMGESHCTAELKVISAGKDDGNMCRLEVRGQHVGTTERGFNLVLLSDTYAPVEVKYFDTADSSIASERLADYVESIPNNRIVLVAVCGSGKEHLSKRAKAALGLLGADRIERLCNSGSLALIGKKGASPGTAPCKIIEPKKGRAVVRYTLPPPRIPLAVDVRAETISELVAMIMVEYEKLKPATASASAQFSAVVSSTSTAMSKLSLLSCLNSLTTLIHQLTRGYSLEKALVMFSESDRRRVMGLVQNILDHYPNIFGSAAVTNDDRSAVGDVAISKAALRLFITSIDLLYPYSRDKCVLLVHYLDRFAGGKVSSLERSVLQLLMEKMSDASSLSKLLTSSVSSGGASSASLSAGGVVTSSTAVTTSCEQTASKVTFAIPPPSKIAPVSDLLPPVELFTSLLAIARAEGSSLLQKLIKKQRSLSVSDLLSSEFVDHTTSRSNTNMKTTLDAIDGGSDVNDHMPGDGMVSDGLMMAHTASNSASQQMSEAATQMLTGLYRLIISLTAHSLSIGKQDRYGFSTKADAPRLCLSVFSNLCTTCALLLNIALSDDGDGTGENDGGADSMPPSIGFGMGSSGINGGVYNNNTTQNNIRREFSTVSNFSIGDGGYGGYVGGSVDDPGAVSGRSNPLDDEVDATLKASAVGALLPMVASCMAMLFESQGRKLLKHGALDAANSIRNCLLQVNRAIARTPAEKLTLSSSPPVAPSNATAVKSEFFESRHPYHSNTDTTTVVSFPGCLKLTITFDERTRTENSYDWVKIWKNREKTESCHPDIDKYTGRRDSMNWPGFGGRPPLVIEGDCCYVEFHSDGSNEDWGYAFTAEAEFRVVASSHRCHWLVELEKQLCHCGAVLATSFITAVPWDENDIEEKNSMWLEDPLLEYGLRPSSTSGSESGSASGAAGGTIPGDLAVSRNSSSSSSLFASAFNVDTDSGSDLSSEFDDTSPSVIFFLDSLIDRPEGSLGAALCAVMKGLVQEDQGHVDDINRAVYATCAALIKHNDLSCEALAVAEGRKAKNNVSDELKKVWRAGQKMRHFFDVGDISAVTRSTNNSYNSHAAHKKKATISASVASAPSSSSLSSVTGSVDEEDDDKMSAPLTGSHSAYKGASVEARRFISDDIVQKASFLLRMGSKSQLQLTSNSNTQKRTKSWKALSKLTRQKSYDEKGARWKELVGAVKTTFQFKEHLEYRRKMAAKSSGSGGGVDSAGANSAVGIGGSCTERILRFVQAKVDVKRLELLMNKRNVRATFRADGIEFMNALLETATSPFSITWLIHNFANTVRSLKKSDQQQRRVHVHTSLDGIACAEQNKLSSSFCILMTVLVSMMACSFDRFKNNSLELSQRKEWKLVTLACMRACALDFDQVDHDMLDSSSLLTVLERLLCAEDADIKRTAWSLFKYLLPRSVGLDGAITSSVGVSSQSYSGDDLTDFGKRMVALLVNSLESSCQSVVEVQRNQQAMVKTANCVVCGEKGLRGHVITGSVVPLSRDSLGLTVPHIPLGLQHSMSMWICPTKSAIYATAPVAGTVTGAGAGVPSAPISGTPTQTQGTLQQSAEIQLQYPEAKTGSRVIRGPQWPAGSIDDGGDDCLGTVTAIDGSKLAVVWDKTKVQGMYKYGVEVNGTASHEVVVVDGTYGGHIVCKGLPGVLSEEELSKSWSSFGLRLRRDGRLSFYAACGEAEFFVHNSADALAQDQWSHVAVVQNLNVHKIYVNGKLSSERVSSAPLLQPGVSVDKESRVIESLHPYLDGSNIFETVEFPGAVAITITFDSRTRTESSYDFVRFYKESSHQEYWGENKYSGGRAGSRSNWPGCGGRPPLLIPASSFVLHFKSDNSNNDWGYRFTATAQYPDERQDVAIAVSGADSQGFKELNKSPLYIGQTADYVHTLTADVKGPSEVTPIMINEAMEGGLCMMHIFETALTDENVCQIHTQLKPALSLLTGTVGSAVPVITNDTCCGDGIDQTATAASDHATVGSIVLDAVSTASSAIPVPTTAATDGVSTCTGIPAGAVVDEEVSLTVLALMQRIVPSLASAAVTPTVTPSLSDSSVSTVGGTLGNVHVVRPLLAMIQSQVGITSTSSILAGVLRICSGIFPYTSVGLVESQALALGLLVKKGVGAGAGATANACDGSGDSFLLFLLRSAGKLLNAWSLYETKKAASCTTSSNVNGSSATATEMKDMFSDARLAVVSEQLHLLRCLAVSDIWSEALVAILRRYSFRLPVVLDMLHDFKSSPSDAGLRQKCADSPSTVDDIDTIIAIFALFGGSSGASLEGLYVGSRALYQMGNNMFEECTVLLPCRPPSPPVRQQSTGSKITSAERKAFEKELAEFEMEWSQYSQFGDAYIVALDSLPSEPIVVPKAKLNCTARRDGQAASDESGGGGSSGDISIGARNVTALFNSFLQSHLDIVEIYFREVMRIDTEDARPQYAPRYEGKEVVQTFESSHPYTTEESYLSVEIEGASEITIEFDSLSRTENKTDYLTFYKSKKHGEYFGEARYTGKGTDHNWPGVHGRPPLVIPKNSFELYWRCKVGTGEDNTSFGYKFTVRAFSRTKINPPPRPPLLCDALLSSISYGGMQALKALLQTNVWMVSPVMTIVEPLVAAALRHKSISYGDNTTTDSLSSKKPLVLEGTHPYLDNANDYIPVRVKGARKLKIVFDEMTSTESGCDYLKLYKDDKHNEMWGDKYTGGKDGGSSNWPGSGGRPPLIIPANNFIIHFRSDGSVNCWGWKMYITILEGSADGDVNLDSSETSCYVTSCLRQLLADGPASVGEPTNLKSFPLLTGSGVCGSAGASNHVSSTSSSSSSSDAGATMTEHSDASITTCDATATSITDSKKTPLYVTDMFGNTIFVEAPPPSLETVAAPSLSSSLCSMPLIQFVMNDTDDVHELVIRSRPDMLAEVTDTFRKPIPASTITSLFTVLGAPACVTTAAAEVATAAESAPPVVFTQLERTNTSAKSSAHANEGNGGATDWVRVSYRVTAKPSEDTAAGIPVTSDADTGPDANAAVSAVPTATTTTVEKQGWTLYRNGDLVLLKPYSAATDAVSRIGTSAAAVGGDGGSGPEVMQDEEEDRVITVGEFSYHTKELVTLDAALSDTGSGGSSGSSSSGNGIVEEHPMCEVLDGPPRQQGGGVPATRDILSGHVNSIETAVIASEKVSCTLLARDCISILMEQWPANAPFSPDYFGGSAEKMLAFIRGIFSRHHEAAAVETECGGSSGGGSSVLDSLKRRLVEMIQSSDSSISGSNNSNEPSPHAMDAGDLSVSTTAASVSIPESVHASTLLSTSLSAPAEMVQHFVEFSLKQLTDPLKPLKPLKPVRALTKKIETEHNYADNMDASWELNFPGALYLKIIFDPRSASESGCDFCNILKSKDSRISWNPKPYTGSGSGKSWAGVGREPPCIVNADHCVVTFHSDSSNNDWGFLLTCYAVMDGPSEEELEQAENDSRSMNDSSTDISLGCWLLQMLFDQSEELPLDTRKTQIFTAKTFNALIKCVEMMDIHHPKKPTVVQLIISVFQRLNSVAAVNRLLDAEAKIAFHNLQACVVAAADSMYKVENKTGILRGTAGVKHYSVLLQALVQAAVISTSNSTSNSSRQSGDEDADAKSAHRTGSTVAPVMHWEGDARLISSTALLASAEADNATESGADVGVGAGAGAGVGVHRQYALARTKENMVAVDGASFTSASIHVQFSFDNYDTAAATVAAEEVVVDACNHLNPDSPSLPCAIIGVGGRDPSHFTFGFNISTHQFECFNASNGSVNQLLLTDRAEVESSPATELSRLSNGDVFSLEINTEHMYVLVSRNTVPIACAKFEGNTAAASSCGGSSALLCAQFPLSVWDSFCTSGTAVNGVIGFCRRDTSSSSDANNSKKMPATCISCALVDRYLIAPLFLEDLSNSLMNQEEVDKQKALAAVALVPSCNSGHKCVHTVGHAHIYSIDSTVLCDMCRARGLQRDSQGYYHCSGCRFDLCMRCSADRVRVDKLHNTAGGSAAATADADVRKNKSKTMHEGSRASANALVVLPAWCKPVQETISMLLMCADANRGGTGTSTSVSNTTSVSTVVGLNDEIVSVMESQSAVIVESTHPFNNSPLRSHITIPGAASLTVSFDNYTQMHAEDVIEVYGGGADKEALLGDAGLEPIVTDSTSVVSAPTSASALRIDSKSVSSLSLPPQSLLLRRYKGLTGGSTLRLPFEQLSGAEMALTGGPLVGAACVGDDVAAAHLRALTQLKKRLIDVGDIVVRGASWEWGDEDGGAGSLGVVTEVKAWKGKAETGVVVQWRNSGVKGLYRWNYQGCRDVRMVQLSISSKLPVVTPGNEVVLVCKPSGSNSDSVTAQPTGACSNSSSGSSLQQLTNGASDPLVWDGAARFDGLQSRISIEVGAGAAPAWELTGSCTVECLVKLHPDVLSHINIQAATYIPIISRKVILDDMVCPQFQFGINQLPNGKFTIVFKYSNESMQPFSIETPPLPSVSNVETQPTITVGKWMHLALVISPQRAVHNNGAVINSSSATTSDSMMAQFIINGVIVHTAMTNPNRMASMSARMEVGYESFWSGGEEVKATYLNGYIHDLRIWGKARSVKEIDAFRSDLLINSDGSAGLACMNSIGGGALATGSSLRNSSGAVYTPSAVREGLMINVAVTRAELTGLTSAGAGARAVSNRAALSVATSAFQLAMERMENGGGGSEENVAANGNSCSIVPKSAYVITSTGLTWDSEVECFKLPVGTTYGFKATIRPTFTYQSLCNNPKFTKDLARVMQQYTAGSLKHDVALVKYINEVAVKKGFSMEQLLKLKWSDIEPSAEELVRMPVLKELIEFNSGKKKAGTPTASNQVSPSKRGLAGGGDIEEEESKEESGDWIEEKEDDDVDATNAVTATSACGSSGVGVSDDAETAQEEEDEDQQQAPHANWVQLPYKNSPFDTNGILYYIGAAGGQCEYVNPHQVGAVVASKSSTWSGHDHIFVGRTNSGRNATTDTPGSWMKVDLLDHRVIPTHYCLKNDVNSFHYMCSWKLQGSLDNIHWTDVDTQTHSTSPLNGSYKVCSFPITNTNMAAANAAINSPTTTNNNGFRYFRVLQTDKNSEGKNYLLCSGFELYGALNYQPKGLNNNSGNRKISLSLVEHRLKVLQQLNGAMVKALAFVDFCTVDKPWTLGALVASCRAIIFQCAKVPGWNALLEATGRSSDRNEFELRLNRISAGKYARTGQVDHEARHMCFSQAFRVMHVMDPAGLRKKSKLYDTIFLGEHSQDAGGPYRESFVTYTMELQSDALPLLIRTPNGRHAVGQNRDKYLLNPGANTLLHMEMLSFLGKLMGVAIRSKEYLALNIAPLIWKLLVGEIPTLEDLEAVDSSHQNSIRSIRHIDQQGIDAETFGYSFFETFTTLSMNDKVVELGLGGPLGGGASRAVTFENRAEFCDLVDQYRLHSFDSQAAAVRSGLAQVVPIRYLSLFTWDQLEMMVCGVAEIDVELLKSITEYSSCSATDQHVELFWTAVREFNTEERSALLKFTWGRSRLPLDAQSFTQRFKIQSFNRSPADSYLPVAHTCFFSLELPRYSTLEIMKEKLRYAIFNCTAIDGDDTSIGMMAAGLGSAWDEEE